MAVAQRGAQFKDSAAQSSGEWPHVPGRIGQEGFQFHALDLGQSKARSGLGGEALARKQPPHLCRGADLCDDGGPGFKRVASKPARCWARR